MTSPRQRFVLSGFVRSRVGDDRVEVPWRFRGRDLISFIACSKPPGFRCVFSMPFAVMTLWTWSDSLTNLNVVTVSVCVCLCACACVCLCICLVLEGKMRLRPDHRCAPCLPRSSWDPFIHRLTYKSERTLLRLCLREWEPKRFNVGAGICGSNSSSLLGGGFAQGLTGGQASGWFPVCSAHWSRTVDLKQNTDAGSSFGNSGLIGLGCVLGIGY